MTTLTFNGVVSSSFGINLKQPVKFDNVERDVEIIEIPGRDGALLRDNFRYKTVNLSLDAYMKKTKKYKTLVDQITAAKTWLGGSYGYKQMSWSGEEDRLYIAQINGNAEFTRNTAFFADVSIPLTLQPYKYFASSYNTSISLTSGQSVTNLGTQPAKPIITLTGTGNVTLTVGSQKFILQNITGGVVIDCEKQVVMDLTKTISRMEWVYSYPFPVLPTGSTVISWNNSAFTSKIIERWCDLA